MVCGHSRTVICVTAAVLFCRHSLQRSFRGRGGTTYSFVRLSKYGNGIKSKSAMPHGESFCVQSWSVVGMTESVAVCLGCARNMLLA